MDENQIQDGAMEETPVAPEHTAGHTSSADEAEVTEMDEAVEGDEKEGEAEEEVAA